MTSTAIVQAEINRFLRSAEPEVLCITGEWGVGKTYNWQFQLDHLRTSREVGLARYSYISLFGINSLDALKQSIFENMEFLLPEGQSAFERMTSGLNRSFQQSKKLAGALSAIPVVGDALSRISQPFLFTSIRSQIVCIDDLERRGGNLSVKDVFGLISYLREQRNCKVVLLLNIDELDKEAKKDFKDHFEKVVDAKVVFAPTAEEAAAIAFPSKDQLSQLIAEHSVNLGVKNIRVLKKIERLIGIVHPVITDLGEDIRRQVIHTLVILGWSHFDSGAKPPPLIFLRQSSLARYMDRDKKAATEDEERWEAITESYKFSHMDDFDLALMSFVEGSVLNVDEIRKEAQKQRSLVEARQKVESFQNAFRCLHDSFSDNEEDVCSEIMSGVKESIEVVGLSEIDAVVDIFSRLDRQELVDELIDFVKKNTTKGFWIADDPFRREVKSARLRMIVDDYKEAEAHVLDFERDLIAVVENRDDEVLSQLAALPVQRYVDLFKNKTGEDLRRVILAALDSRKIINSTPDQQLIVRKAEEALLEIGGKSKLNAIRVMKYGIFVPLKE